MKNSKMKLDCWFWCAPRVSSLLRDCLLSSFMPSLMPVSTIIKYHSSKSSKRKSNFQPYFSSESMELSGKDRLLSSCSNLGMAWLEFEPVLCIVLSSKPNTDPSPIESERRSSLRKYMTLFERQCSFKFLLP